METLPYMPQFPCSGPVTNVPHFWNVLPRNCKSNKAPGLGMSDPDPTDPVLKVDIFMNKIVFYK